MLSSLLFPCSYFLWGYSIDIFSILRWTQSSLILSFYSNISTYCHTFLSKCGLTLFQKCQCICFVWWWPWRCAARLSFERLCCENTAERQLLHHLIPSQAAQSQGPSTARVPEQGLICWIWDSFNGQPWLGDSHQLGWGFLRTATVWSSSLLILLSFVFSQTSVLHHSLKALVAYSFPVPLYSSRASPQNSSCTSHSVLVSASQRTQTDTSVFVIIHPKCFQTPIKIPSLLFMKFFSQNV